MAAIKTSRRGIGTLTRLHASRMQLELLGLAEPAPAPATAESAAIRATASAISIANLLSLWRSG